METIVTVPSHRSLAPYHMRQRTKICGMVVGRPCAGCIGIFGVFCIIFGIIMFFIGEEMALFGIIFVSVGLILFTVSMVFCCITRENYHVFHNPEQTVSPGQPTGNPGQPSIYQESPSPLLGQPAGNPNQPAPCFGQQAPIGSQPAAYPKQPYPSQPAAPYYGQTAPGQPAPGQMTMAYQYIPPAEAVPQALAPTNYPIAPPTNPNVFPSAPMPPHTDYQTKGEQPPPYVP